jgi:tetratricopeptide (TPR) repeat protein
VRASAVAAGALAVVAVVAAVEARRAARPVCSTAAPEVARVWGGADKDAASTAFRATGKPFAEDAFRGAAKALDAYGSAWVTMRDDACQATLVRAQQSSELMDLRMACLEDRLSSMRALVARFARADAKVVENALRAADALPPLSECADATALRAPVRPPTDPTARARIAGVRARLADARAVRNAAAPTPEDLAAAHQAVEDARATGYAPVLAEALENEGVELELAHKLPDAVASLQEAQLTAVTAHDTTLETLTWIELAHADETDHRTAEGKSAALQAHAGISRDGGDDLRLSRLLGVDARLADDEGRFAEAIDAAKRALAIREQRLPGDHPDIAEGLNDLSVIAFDAGDLDAAIDYSRRALSIREAAFGPNHPAVGAALGNLANALDQQGKCDEAVEDYQRVLAVFTAAFGPDDPMVIYTWDNLGQAYNDKEDYAAALDAQTRALRLGERVLGPTHPEVVTMWVNLAVTYRRLRRYDDAIAAAQRYVGLTEAANGPDDPEIVIGLTNIGQTLSDEHENARALPYLERAVGLATKGGVPPRQIAMAQEDLALVLRDLHRDPARARDLAAQARAQFASEKASADLGRMDEEFPAPK